MKAILRSIKKNRELIFIFTKREIETRYRGSWLGLLWSCINPLIMLSVYTIVFSKIFNAKWGNLGNSNNESPTVFAINLFAGLIVFNIFAECVSASPRLVTANPNYVKKVIFPIEVLGIAVTGNAAFHGFINLAILMAAQLLVGQSIPITIVFIPVLWGSYILGICALGWALSIIGVYFRDIGLIVNSTISILMFMSQCSTNRGYTRENKVDCTDKSNSLYHRRNEKHSH